MAKQNKSRKKTNMDSTGYVESDYSVDINKPYPAQRYDLPGSMSDFHYQESSDIIKSEHKGLFNAMKKRKSKNKNIKNYGGRGK